MEKLKKIIYYYKEKIIKYQKWQSVKMSTKSLYKTISKITIAEENVTYPLTIIKKLGSKFQDNTTAVESVAEIVQFDNSLTQTNDSQIRRAKLHLYSINEFTASP